MEYETKSHCKYLIALHLILVVKYRKQLLKGDVGDFVKQKITEIAVCLGSNLDFTHQVCLGSNLDFTHQAISQFFEL